MTKRWRFICLGVVLALVLSLGAVLVAQAGPGLNSATPPDGYQPQPTQEKYGGT